MKVIRPSTLLLLLLLPLLTSAKSCLPLVWDGWSEKVTWRTADGWYAAPIHAALLPDGQILFIGSARSTEDPDAPHEAKSHSFTMTPTPLG